MKGKYDVYTSVQSPALQKIIDVNQQKEACKERTEPKLCSWIPGTVCSLEQSGAQIWDCQL